MLAEGLRHPGSDTQGHYYSGYSRQNELNVFNSSPCPPHLPTSHIHGLHEAMQVDRAHTEIVSQLKNPKLRNHNLLKVLLVNLPKYCLIGRHLLNLSSAIEGDIICLFQAICYTNFKKIVWNKSLYKQWNGEVFPNKLPPSKYVSTSLLLELCLHKKQLNWFHFHFYFIMFLAHRRLSIYLLIECMCVNIPFRSTGIMVSMSVNFAAGLIIFKIIIHLNIRSMYVYVNLLFSLYLLKAFRLPFCFFKIKILLKYILNKIQKWIIMISFLL